MTYIIISLILAVVVVYSVTFLTIKGGVKITIKHTNSTEYRDNTEHCPVPVKDTDAAVPVEEAELSDREKQERLLSDAASAFNAICNGEVDIDDLRP